MGILVVPLTGRSVLAIVCFFFLVAGGFNVAGLSAWKDSAPGFQLGAQAGTRLSGGAITLDFNLSTPGIWRIAETAFPPARIYHAMAWDSHSGLVVLFGGQDRNGKYLNDTWTFNSSSGIWTQQAPAVSPPARAMHSLVADDRNGVLVLFGGANDNSGNNFRNDTWTYNASTQTWTNMSPPVAPSARCSFGMAYDRTNGIVVLAGGSVAASPPYLNTKVNDTWFYKFTVNNWTCMNATSAFPARCAHTLEWDEVTGSCVLFGGLDINIIYLNDTWAYKAGTNTWTRQTPALSPPVRFDHCTAFDRLHGKTLLFGGAGYSASLNDTWLYDSLGCIWTDISIPGGPGPSWGARMAFDGNTGAAVVFGGFNGTSTSYYNESWTFFTAGHVPSGTYTSVVHDSGGTPYYGKLEWSADLPAGTGITFQARSGDNVSGLSVKRFTGPDGTANTSYTPNWQGISSADNGSRYFQYRAYLWTDDPALTPALGSVTVNYNLIHNVTIIYPKGGEALSGTQTIRWNATDPDGDALMFNVYSIPLGGLPKLIATDLKGDSYQLDTAAHPQGTYRIQVVARDDNPAIPLNVNAISNEFKVVRPVLNRPPIADLVYPMNYSVLNSNEVTLIWKGSDADCDRITYNLTLAEKSFDSPNRRYFTTIATSLIISNLTNNMTYYWAVTPFDGKDYGRMTAIYVFEVHLAVPPPINHPPKLNGTPPTGATVGVEYSYTPSASDPNNDPLTFSLDRPPAGMIINPGTGKVQWVPSQAGTYSITLQVTDGRGGQDSKTFNVTVLVAGARPICAISSPLNGTVVSATITISGVAAKGASPLDRVEVRIDGGAWKQAQGQDSWSFKLDTRTLANGKHTIEARSYGGQLYSVVAKIEVTVDNSGTPPVIPSTNDVTTDQFPWPTLLCILLAVGLVFLLYLKGRRRDH